MTELAILVDPAPVDWTGLHRLLINSYEYMDERIDPPSSLHQMVPADLAAKAQAETLLIAGGLDEMAGCLYCRTEGEWLYVGKMAVATTRQGQGIGRALIERARLIAAERKLTGLELETRIELTENHRAFAKMGFVKVADQSHDGYDRTTSIRMRALLTPNAI